MNGTLGWSFAGCLQALVGCSGVAGGTFAIARSGLCARGSRAVACTIHKPRSKLIRLVTLTAGALKVRRCDREGRSDWGKFVLAKERKLGLGLPLGSYLGLSIRLAKQIRIHRRHLNQSFLLL